MSQARTCSRLQRRTSTAAAAVPKAEARSLASPPYQRPWPYAKGKSCAGFPGRDPGLPDRAQLQLTNSGLSATLPDLDRVPILQPTVSRDPLRPEEIRLDSLGTRLWPMSRRTALAIGPRPMQVKRGPSEAPARAKSPGLAGRHVPSNLRSPPVQRERGSSRPALALATLEPGATASPTLGGLALDDGQPLPEGLLRTAETLLGTSLSEAELHTGESADRAAEALGARAFTIGPHIFFRGGRYAPHTEPGRALLLHELTHAAQWIRGDVPAGASLELAQPGHPLEREADSLSARLAPMLSLSGRMARMSSRTERDVDWPPRGPSRSGSARGVGATGLILRELERGGAVRVAAPTEVPDGGVPVNRLGVVNWDREPKLRLRASASTTENNVIRELDFNSRVLVIKRFPGDWLFVSTEQGELGYVASAYVSTNLPEPNAKLHRVEAGLGGTAIAIAEQYYGEHADDWGQDLRFYVNVLAWANRRQVPNTTSGWRSVHFQAGELIWIPSQPFARSLKGVVESGSYTYDVASLLGIAGLMERVAQLWDDFAHAISLAGTYIPEALARHSLEGLEQGLAALIDMLLIAGIVMILSTALGAAIGALAGGVGAAPGSAAGFEVGLLILQWMGLAFLVVWVADALSQIGAAFGSFIATVWGAHGDEVALDQAARQLAKALGITASKIIEGLVMLAGAKGIGFVIGKLAGTRFAQKLGSRFNEWLRRKVEGRREAERGETGTTEAGVTEAGATEATTAEAGRTGESTGREGARTRDISRLVSERRDGSFRLNRKRVRNVHKIVGEPEAQIAAHAAREAYAAERAAALDNVERVYMGREADRFINPDIPLGTKVSADVVAVTRNGKYVLIEAKGTEIRYGLNQLRHSGEQLGHQQVLRYELVVPEQIRTPGYTIEGGYLFLDGQPYLIHGKRVRVHTTTQTRQR